MDKNEINEALNELSGRIIAIGQHVGTPKTSDELIILHESLERARAELSTHIRVLQSAGY